MRRETIRAGITAGMLSAMVLLTAHPVMAANYPDAKQAAGGQTQFDKYLVMPENSPVPAASFSYTITGAGNAKAYSEGNVAIYDGITTDSAPVITWDASAADSPGTVLFLPSDPTVPYSRASNDQKGMVKGLGSGEKFAQHTATVSFSGIHYPEPGIYRYKITEAASTQKGITNDSNLSRYLDVYVVDDGEGALSVSAYVLHASDGNVPANTAHGSDGSQNDYKSQGFTNRYQSYCLELSKTVSGNQASHDKYFKFHVKIERAAAGTVYVVSLGDDGNAATTDGDAQETPTANQATDPGYTNMHNPTTMTAANGTAEEDFYLQHGQKIVIRGIAPDSKVTVTETPEDYAPSYTVNNGAGADGSTVSLEAAASDNVIAFTNTRSGVIPTGVVVTILPYGIAAAIAGAGYLLFRRRREDDDED